MPLSSELLPCPFCGGAAERLDIEYGENAGGSCISCTVCQASSNVEFGHKENFVSNWNRRQANAAEASAAKLRDEVVKVLEAASGPLRYAYRNVSSVTADKVKQEILPEIDALLAALQPKEPSND